MNPETLLAHLQRLAEQSLPLWDLPEGTTATLLNVSENATYRMDATDGSKWALRIHREDYHTLDGIQTELDWMHALQHDADVITPQAIAGVNGKEIQEGIVEGLPGPRRMVLFAFIDGIEPEEDHDLIEPFRRLGEVSAKLHMHAVAWPRPAHFERLVWDVEHVLGLGVEPNWGFWRDGPAGDVEEVAQLQRIQDAMVTRLAAYGREPERFGLAHSDLRLANLLLVGDSTRVIDFDDCGTGWFLYDLATAMTLIDNTETSGALIQSWLDGYLPLRPLDDADRKAIPDLIMMRRFAMLAWFGSHADTELARQNSKGYAAEFCLMGEAYMAEEPGADNPAPWL
ncbi:MAG: phosphotransferase [Rhodospirillales bacterium]|nr:phosphotransferase [Rhodospirillales bacterium]